MTPYPDTRMFDGLKAFQKENGLKIDGMMKPGGPTENTLAARSPVFWCKIRGAPHGDVEGTGICPDCTKKRKQS